MAQRLDLPLVPSRSAPRQARRAITELVVRTGRADLAATAALLVSELVTNAITHASGPIGVTAACLDGTLRVEVRDGEPAPPILRHSSAIDEAGRGLAVVAHIAHAWGIFLEADGKTVWFELN